MEGIEDEITSNYCRMKSRVWTRLFSGFFTITDLAISNLTVWSLKIKHKGCYVRKVHCPCFTPGRLLHEVHVREVILRAFA